MCRRLQPDVLEAATPVCWRLPPCTLEAATLPRAPGTITEAFEPFHAELLNASALDEVTAAALAQLLKKSDGQTGTAQARGTA